MLVATGDGSFLMNSQEIETALRVGTPMVILIWVDDAYGLISWKMDLEIGHNVDTRFGNPDFVAYAESFGAKGYRISAADELLPTLREALADDTVSVIACPVDYSRQQRPDRLARRTGRVLVVVRTCQPRQARLEGVVLLLTTRGLRTAGTYTFRSRPPDANPIAAPNRPPRANRRTRDG